MEDDLQGLSESPLSELTNADLVKLGGSYAALELARRNAGLKTTDPPGERTTLDHARAAAAERGLLRSDLRLAAGGFADLDYEIARIHADAPRRLAAIEEMKRRQRERDADHARRALMQPVESPLADRGYLVGFHGGWERLVDRARFALADDARRDRDARNPVAEGTDWDDRDHESPQLNPSDAVTVAKVQP